MTIKAEQLGTSRWRVLAIPFGGPLKGGRDLDGEYFSPNTDVKAEWFKERPVLWHHGQDDAVADAELGIQGELKREDDGWWAEVWLDRSNRYWAQVDAMLRAGKMYGSSGALAHLVRKSRDGEILVWPHIEQTLTPTPANPWARITASKAVQSFTQANIPLDPVVKSVLADLDATASDLPADLGGYSPGDAAAMRRLAEALDALEGVISTIRTRY